MLYVTIERVGEESQADVEVLDIFSDDRIPGYQVWRRGGDRSTAMAVRIPRQIVGWKAVLMDASGLFDAEFMNGESVKKARRRSKMVGKQGWEVRKEPLKDSYDFRTGPSAGICATMHAGGRLFKQDWHVLGKDGSKYVWRMDKHGLALYREEDDLKVAEFRKSLSSSYANGASNHSSISPDEMRIGSLIYIQPRALSTSTSRIGFEMLDANLTLASLMAIFNAQKGPRNISAAYEPSQDPLRQKLEEERRNARDREEVMLALPRPGFARDRESVMSVMSDTTDEDADTSTSDVRPNNVLGHVQQRSEERFQSEAKEIARRYRRQSMFAGH